MNTQIVTGLVTLFVSLITALIALQWRHHRKISVLETLMASEAETLNQDINGVGDRLGKAKDDFRGEIREVRDLVNATRIEIARVDAETRSLMAALRSLDQKDSDHRNQIKSLDERLQRQLSGIEHRLLQVELQVATESARVAEMNKDIDRLQAIHGELSLMRFSLERQGRP